MLAYVGLSFYDRIYYIMSRGGREEDIRGHLRTFADIYGHPRTFLLFKRVDESTIMVYNLKREMVTNHMGDAYASDEKRCKSPECETCLARI